MKILHTSNVLKLFPGISRCWFLERFLSELIFNLKFLGVELEGYDRYLKGIKISSSQFGEKLKRISVKPQGVDFKRNFPPLGVNLKGNWVCDKVGNVHLSVRHLFKLRLSLKSGRIEKLHKRKEMMNCRINLNINQVWKLGQMIKFTTPSLPHQLI